MKIIRGKTEGWAKPSSFAKYHYFAVDGMSLCRCFRILWHELIQGNDDSPDNCKKCRELRAKEIKGAKK